MNCTQQNKESGGIIKFKHEHSIFMLNLREIVSVKVENFYVGQGENFSRGKYFIWGRYNVVVQYLECQKKQGLPAEKILYRAFSCVSTPSGGCTELVNNKDSLICEASCNYIVTPVSFFLFPLLNKIKFMPFKITLVVEGSIKRAMENEFQKVPAENETQLKKIEVHPTEVCPQLQGGTLMETAPQDEKQPKKSTAGEEKQGAAVKEREKKQQKDFAPSEKMKLAGSVPAPSPQSYKTYRLFYDYFYGKRQDQRGSTPPIK